MKIWKAEVVKQSTSDIPGTIAKVGKNVFYVQTGNGQIGVRELQLPGKKRMDTGSFLRGSQVEVGVRLG